MERFFSWKITGESIVLWDYERDDQGGMTGGMTGAGGNVWCPLWCISTEGQKRGMTGGPWGDHLHLPPRGISHWGDHIRDTTWGDHMGHHMGRPHWWAQRGDHTLGGMIGETTTKTTQRGMTGRPWTKGTTGGDRGDHKLGDDRGDHHTWETTQGYHMGRQSRDTTG